MEALAEDIEVGGGMVERWQNLLNQPRITERRSQNDRDNRYIWYAGEDIPWHIDELPGGWVERCRVTPILPKPVWDNEISVPDILQTDTRGEKSEEARYEIQPLHVFNSFMARYGAWGVVELRALVGMQLDRFMALQIDQIFTPWPKDRNAIDPKTDRRLDRCPKEYSAIRAHIVWTAKQIKDEGSVTIRGAIRHLDNESCRLLLLVAEDMILSLQRSEAFDVALVDGEESGKDPQYTVHGLRALDRLGRRRRDQALNDMAGIQNQVFKEIPKMLQLQSDQTGLMALVEAQREANALLQQQLEIQRAEAALQRQAMELLLKERQASQSPASEPEPPAPTAPKIPQIPKNGK